MDKSSSASGAVPPSIKRRTFPIALGVSLGGLALAGALVLFLFDPVGHGFYPSCLFKQTTGYDCSGCGGLRSVHQLLHGNVWSAFQLNAMVVIALPITAMLLIRSRLIRRRTTCQATSVSLVWVWVAVALVILFGVVRNLPIWPFGVTPM